MNYKRELLESKEVWKYDPKEFKRLIYTYNFYLKLGTKVKIKRKIGVIVDIDYGLFWKDDKCYKVVFNNQLSLFDSNWYSDNEFKVVN